MSTTVQTGALVFENTVNLGNILTMVSGALIWAVTLAIAWTKLGGRIDLMNLRVSLLEAALEKIATVLDKFIVNEKEVLALKLQVAALESQHATLFKTVEDLRRGNGFIRTPRREGIEGEHP